MSLDALNATVWQDDDRKAAATHAYEPNRRSPAVEQVLSWPSKVIAASVRMFSDFGGGIHNRSPLESETIAKSAAMVSSFLDEPLCGLGIASLPSGHR